MARKLFGAALKSWRKARGRKSSSRRSRPRARTAPPPRRSGRRFGRRTSSVAPRRRRSSSPGGVLGFLSQVIWPAIGIGLSGAVVRLVPQADTPVKRGFVAGAAAAGLRMLSGPLGRVGVSRGVVNGVALGMGIDAAWRGSTGIRSKIGLSGGGPTGGLLSGRNPFQGMAPTSHGRALPASRSVFAGSNVFDRLARVTQ